MERSTRLISEALDSVVTRTVRDALLSRALKQASLAAVPTGIDELERFVEGPLAEALVVGLGADLAASVLEQIALVTRLPPHGAKARRSSRAPAKRSSSPPPRRHTPAHRIAAQRKPSSPALAAASSRRAEPSQPAPRTLVPPPPARRLSSQANLTPPPRSGPAPRNAVPWGSDEYPSGGSSLGLDAAAEAACLLVVSLDTQLVQRLSPWVGGKAELIQVGSVRELVRDLDVLESARVTVLVDCRRPSIRPTAVAALADELPESVRVVLWGASPEQERALRAVSPEVARWAVVPADARPKDLIARCVTQTA